MDTSLLPEGSLQQTEEYLVSIEPFRQTLLNHGVRLERERTTTLQINVGLQCNQACKHCHLSAGPLRKEMMDKETLDQVVGFAQRNGVDIIDITGGAPELHPNLISMVERFGLLAPRLMVRSNLSALEEGDPDRFVTVFRDYQVVVVASFPSLNPAQADSQRGKGIFDKSIAALKRLNDAGYGKKDSGLELDLVSNPTGAFLPPAQARAEERFRSLLIRRWGIEFNNLFTFANVPLGRFRRWLMDSGNFDTYMNRLVSSFNPCAVKGLMCRTLLSVAWDGYLYDCDFNLSKGLPLGGRRTHISEMEALPEPGTPIAVANHCYTCAAGTGFT